MYTIYSIGKTDTGKLRTNNEDVYFDDKIWDNSNDVLGIVIDGVGGYAGGEVAAQIAKDSIVTFLKKGYSGEKLDLLKEAVTYANNEIVKEREKQFPDMSCVLTACIVEVEKKIINMVHVGDTRLYQYHKNKLKKLSLDHSHVGYLEDTGQLTEEEAMNHHQRNIVDRTIGYKEQRVDDEDFLFSRTFDLESNTTLLLCSDGLCDMITSGEIASVLQQSVPLDEKVDMLIQAANDKGGKDNITVVLIEYDINVEDTIDEDDGYEEEDDDDDDVEEDESMDHDDTDTDVQKEDEETSYDESEIEETQSYGDPPKIRGYVWLFVFLGILFGFAAGCFFTYTAVRLGCERCLPHKIFPSDSTEHTIQDSNHSFETEVNENQISNQQ